MQALSAILRPHSLGNQCLGGPAQGNQCLECFHELSWQLLGGHAGYPDQRSGYSQAAQQLLGGRAGYPDKMSGHSQAAQQDGPEKRGKQSLPELRKKTIYIKK